jgi:uncharacterized protein (DUF1697 family)
LTAPTTLIMAPFIALLRAVNLGSTNAVSMAALRDLTSALGFTNVRTALQSGNLVFHTSRRAPAALERLLEAEMLKGLGVRTRFFVRTAADWQSTIENNPFPAEAKANPSRLIVVFLKDAVTAEGLASLRAAIHGQERVGGVGRQAYLSYPDGISTSRVTAALIEKHVGTSGTGRTWNTVVRLAGMV